MTQRSLVLCATLGASVVAGSLTLMGCGGGEPSKAEVAEERTRLTNVLSAEVMRREQVSARARESACRSQVGRALSLLDKQPHALSGPKEPLFLASLDTYSERVEEISTEMGRIPRGSLDQRCLQVHRMLGAAEAVHRAVIEEWSDCLNKYGSFCDTIISLCAGDNPPKDTCEETNNLQDSFELSMDVMRLTAQIMRDDWQAANTRLRNAKDLLDAMGTVEHANQNVPRSERAVGGSVIGRAVALLCAGDSVPSDAVEPCQDLRDVLIQGVADDEDSDLNTALSGLVDAYQLRPNE